MAERKGLRFPLPLREDIDRRQLAVFFGTALLAIPVSIAVAGMFPDAKAQEQPDRQPVYLDLPGWDCNQENLIVRGDRGVIDYTRPQTSISNEQIVVTFPAVEGDSRFYQTVIYENPGLEPGQVLRYYSDSRNCPLPDGAQTIPAS